MFASPRHLNLRLQCTNKTPVKKRLRIWPEFPIVVSCHSSSNAPLPGVSNIDAALKCVDRVCEINLFGVPKPLLKRLGAMDVSFPALTCLRLSSKTDDCDLQSLPILPDSFLGGITPRLQSLDLDGVPFPAPRKLLLSTTNLITLRLERITYLGYISPEDMATCLSPLTKLEELALGFRVEFVRSYYLSQTSRHPLPIPFTILPALTSFWFRGHLEYFETLVSQIRHPLLESVDITLLRQPELGSSRFREFMSRIETLELLQRADIAFQDDSVDITLSPPYGPADCRTLKIRILWGKSDCQPMYLSHFCRVSLPALPTLEHLYIHSSFPGGYYIRTSYSLDLLRPFVSVKDLHVSENAELRVAHALDLLSQESKAEVLPSLKNIFLLGSKPSGTIQMIAQFIFTRSLFGHPISIHYRQGGNWVAKLLREVDN